jgi:uncharacterized protein (DUF58 family)
MAARKSQHGPFVQSRFQLWARLARLIGLLGIILLATLLHSRALAAVAVMAAVLLTGILVPYLTVRGVRAHWDYPLRRGQVGKAITVRLKLRSRLPWPAVGLVVGGGWADSKGSADPLTVAVPSLPVWGEREVATTIIPTQRGVYPRRRGVLASAFPFGLQQTTKRVGSMGEVLVWPQIVPLQTTARDSGVVGHGQATLGRQSGLHGEFAGARPYRVGEPLRQIHWKQSARHDELIVWESRAAARGAVLLLLETDLEVHTRQQAGSSLEKTLSVGASFAWELAEQGLHVTMVFEPGQVLSASSLLELAAVLDALTRFDPSRGASQEALLASVPTGITRSATVWAVTTVAGWTRGSSQQRAPRRVVVIDERAAEQQGPLPAKVARVPLVDPDHRRLIEAWKEITANGEALV